MWTSIAQVVTKPASGSVGNGFESVPKYEVCAWLRTPSARYLWLCPNKLLVGTDIKNDFHIAKLNHLALILCGLGLV